ncbi:L-type lectin-domain containing receptor kinase VIII.1-like [Bidens hawaiensis]|uniref:L-type lectin-domain containing receptor kinase VIII.1-like n=1 Tax=Bidens hawaiensis TaxID=980011 RepID=UPI004048FE84
MLAPDEFTVGRPGPWLGMLNDACDEEYKAVGIEFDTRENVEFGDPNDDHIGINLGSIVSTITINVSEFGLDLKNGEIQRAWIDYQGQNRVLAIQLGPDSGGYPSKPVFEGKLDISEFLNEYMFVGFSASTGNFTQMHNLISWNFTSTSRASLRVPSLETCESRLVRGDSGGGGGGGDLNGFFIFMSVVLLAIVAFVSLYYNRKRGKEKSNTVAMLSEVKERPRPPNKPRRFTISEVSKATRCFDELHKVANDERSDTYHGTLLNGCHVVVKRFLVEYFKSSGVNRRHVCKQIKAMSKLRHPNLVPIRGWCFDHQETMVVYDYVPNGVLDDWLYGNGVLPWSRRLKVVRDVAHALNYLHSQKRAHKNVKTSSVFIDVSIRALLGDFGFVMPGPESNRFVESISQPTDVFEFGVVLLEVVAGRNRYRSRTESDRESDVLDSDLLQWTWTMHEINEKEKVVDGRLGSVLNLDQAVRIVEIGLLCTLKENAGRPNMAEVMEYLNFETEIPKLPTRRPVTLFPYTSTTQLCNNSYMCASFK